MYRNSFSEKRIESRRQHTAAPAGVAARLILGCEFSCGDSDVECHPPARAGRLGLDLPCHTGEILGRLHERSNLRIRPDVDVVPCLKCVDVRPELRAGNRVEAAEPSVGAAIGDNGEDRKQQYREKKSPGFHLEKVFR